MRSRCNLPTRQLNGRPVRKFDDVYILGSEVSSSEDLSLAIGLYNAEAGMGYGGRKPNGDYVDAVRIDNLPGVQPR